MNRGTLKAAADALGRLEALERAHACAMRVPHEAFPISFFDAGEGDGIEERYGSEHGIKVFYPRNHYLTTIEYLIAHERAYLESVDVDLDVDYEGVDLPRGFTA